MTLDNNTIKNEILNPTDKIWNAFIKILREKKPPLAKLLEEIQDMTLEAYAKTYQENRSKNIQPYEDVIEGAFELSNELYGEEIAKKLTKYLHKYRSIITAHHHSPDFLNITIQSSIIASIGIELNDIIPIFSAGTIPLNNISFPLGIIISNKPGNGLKYTTLNVFPKKMQRVNVGSTPSFCKAQILNSMIELDKLWTKTTKLNSETKNILHSIYLNENILSQKSYSDQISILNAQIWAKVIKDKDSVPEISFIEIEKWTIPFVIKDIENKDSLLSTLLFNKSACEIILKNLEGVPCCWSVLQEKGTFCFWYVADDKTYPLFLESDKLKYKDSAFEFKPDTIIELLKSGTIIPSLFTIYTILSFARGFKLVGGMMQIDYMTKIKDAITNALSLLDKQEWIQSIETSMTETYLAGLTISVSDYGNQEIYPSGTIEIIANGGLSQKDLEKIKKITVKEASLLGMPGVLKIITSTEEYNASGFDQYTVADIYELIADKLVTIKI